MNQMQTPPKVENIRKPAAKRATTGREYTEFLPAALEISAAPPPRIVPVLISTITLSLLAIMIWSFFSWLDVYTNAAGRVRSQVPSAVVQPLETGQVKSFNVENGQHVRAGDVLIVLHDVAVSTALDAATAGRASWLGEVQRRTVAYRSVTKDKIIAPKVTFAPEIPRAVVERETAALQSEIQNLAMTLSAKKSEQLEAEARQRRFEEVRDVKLRLHSILTERVKMKESLQNSGVGSKGDLLVISDQQVRVEADLADTSAQLEEIKAAIQNLKQQQDQAISSFLFEQTKAIQTAERQVEQLDQEIRRQRDRKENLQLKAPINGTVQQLAVNSVGQVVNPGQPLMVIVPDHADLIIDALVPSQEIGFVKEGDEVVVKADAFPFTRYGYFEGTVKKISEDAVTSRDAQGLQDATLSSTGQATQPSNGIPNVSGLFYIARIELKQTELTSSGHALRLSPGMTVRAEIKTESRRVIDYILSPVSQVLKESGHER